MATIQGFNFPEDLYYLIEKHVWIKPVKGGLVRVGLTPVAFHLLRGSLVAISIMSRQVGREVAKGKSVAMVESFKYNGPLAAPLTGVLTRGNDKIVADPDLAVADPYDKGWIVEMRPSNWPAATTDLVTGPAAMAAYTAWLRSEKIAWE